FNLSLIPPGQDYSVKAAFSDANGVNRGADVVIAGHSVGQVTGVEVSGKRAMVTMRISSHYAPLHQFTTARIRYSTLLAQKYIEITPINGGAELESGGTLHSDNTLSPGGFDQFPSAPHPGTRSPLPTFSPQAGRAPPVPLADIDPAVGRRTPGPAGNHQRPAGAAQGSLPGIGRSAEHLSPARSGHRPHRGQPGDCQRPAGPES